MCGLVGVFGNIDAQAASMFRWMLYLDVFRGPHSTGILTVEKDNKATTYKELGLPHNIWVNNPDNFNANGLPLGEFKLLMGHNRFATKGEVNKENAHPFTFGHITGCHNGTLQDHDLKRLEDHDKYDVDSKVLFRNIEINGVKNLWKEVTGAMALTWWNSNDNTFNIARNSQRPLSYWSYNNALFWASEDWILRDARAASGFQIRTAFKDVETNTHFSFKYEDGKISEVAEKLPFFSYTPPTYIPKTQGTSTNSQKSDTKKQNDGEEVVVKITDFLPEQDPKMSTAGVFFAENVNNPEEDYVISCYANSREISQASVDKILEASNKHGINLYKFKKSMAYRGTVLGGKTMHAAVNYRFLEPVDMGVDAFGNVISKEDFMEISAGGCSCCYTMITKTSWPNVGKMAVLKDLDIILCPNCAEEKIVEEFVEMAQQEQLQSYSFLQKNWG